jgi:hypothetical protein
MTPTKIGRFEIVSQIAAGADGQVFKATDPKGGRTVAIRAMSREDASPDLIARFRQQAKAASVLESPNIAGLLGGGEWEGGFFVVMEYVEGISLRAMLLEKPKPPYEVLDLCRQVCLALDHAAARGIVHPNLTPANIVVEWDGNLKVLDFGVPKSEGAPAAKYLERLRYLSPEQVRGEALDRRSNLYSWGAILYELVAARPAFAAETVDELRRAILEVIPAAPQESNAAWNAGVSPVILKALSKGREERYASGADLFRELESGNQQKPPEPPRPAAAERKERAPVRNGAAAAAAPAPKPPPVTPPPSPPPRPAASPPAAVPPAAPAPPAPVAAAPAPAAARPAAVKEEPVSVPQAPPAPATPAVAAPAAAATVGAKRVPGGLVVVIVILVGLSLAGGLYLGRRTIKPAQPVATPAKPQTAAPAPVQPAPAAAPVEAPAPEATAKTPAKKGKRAAAPAPPPAPVITIGDLVVNSIPPGAQIQVDGRSEPAWVTPFTIPGLSAGEHTITMAKAGFASQSKTVQVPAGSKALVAVTLAELPATVAVAGTPSGATILIDGKDTGRVSPAQVTVPKGTHTITLRKAGFFEATATAQLGPGTGFNFAPTLKPMGNVESLKTSSGIKKIFGGGAPKGMATVQIKTQPKGAQVSVNGRALDKQTPLEIYLDPGNYEVVVTLAGYKPLRRMISVQKDGKLAIDEALAK